MSEFHKPPVSTTLVDAVKRGIDISDWTPDPTHERYYAPERFPQPTDTSTASAELGSGQLKQREAKAAAKAEE